MHHPDQGLVSPSDIADIAGVTRGAVSNWRKRADDFPAPVGGTSAKPLFSREQVLAWLEGRGHQAKHDAGETAVWAALNLARGHLPVEDMADLILALAVARKSGNPGRGEAPAVPPEIVDPVKAAIDRVAVPDLGAAVDFALERLTRAQGKVGADFGFVGSRTSKLLAGVAATNPGGVLYDPACGIGTALLEAIDRGARPTRAVGHDINSRALRIAAQRAELHGVKLELMQTDVLAEDADPGLLADTIIAEPPFGLGYDSPSRFTDPRFQFGAPPRISADTAWLQHAISHLTPTGRAYVLSTMGSLSRSGEEGRIRTELVRSGSVQAIVGLPSKMLPHTSIPLALWVLARPGESSDFDTVLLVDATESVNPERQVADWLANPESLGAVPHERVSIRDVLAAGSVLSPQRWVDHNEPSPDEITNAYVEGWTKIEEALGSFGRALEAFEHLANFSRSRIMTIGELIEQGVLELRQGRSKDRYGDAPKVLRTRIAEARDIRDGSLHDDALEGEFPNYPELTMPGDVLVTTMNHIRAQVDTAGGHLPATGVYRLRILDDEVMLPHYLALVLTGSWNERFQGGNYIQRASVRELEVPLLPKQEQQDLWGASVFVGFLQSDARRLASQAARVQAALLDAVRYNAPLTRATEHVGPMGQTAPGTAQGDM